MNTEYDKRYRLRYFLFRWGVSAPGLIAQLVFGWMPLIIGILVSFQDFHFQQSKWCGFENYKAVMTDPMSTPFSMKMAKENYAQSLKDYTQTQITAPNPALKVWYAVRSMYYGMGIVWRNTIIYVVMTLGLVFFVPIIVSILLMEMRPWVVRIMMILWFIPISGMASIILLKYFYNVDYGLLNGLLAKAYTLIGLPEAQQDFPRYLNSPKIAMLCLVLPNLIMYTPGLVYITALQGVPQDLYDAAEIDGCGFFQKIWHVTLPRIRPIIVTLFVLAVLSAFQVLNEVMIMTQGGPGNTTMVLGYYIYKMTFDYLDVGKGNALACMFFVFLMTLTILQRIYIKEDKDKGASKETLKLMKEG